MPYKINTAVFAFFFAFFFCVNVVNAAMQVDIYGPAENIVKFSMAKPLCGDGSVADDLGKDLDKAIRDNLSYLPFMRIVEEKNILGGQRLEGYRPPKIDFKRFQLAGADLLITAGWPKGDGSSAVVELRLYETYSGKFVFGSAYKGVTKSEIPNVADKFCADLMKALTGSGDFFLATLAFVKEGKGKYVRDLWIVKPTGKELRQVTDISGIAMSPSWSADGRFIIFTHLDDRTHALGVWDRTTNKVQRIRFHGNTVIGPVFMPDNKIAVSLSTGRYPDIFLLNHMFKKEKVLEENPSINVSPSFDAKGQRMAFCSNRLCGPQIFMKDFATGAVTRVSRHGGYNTEPAISPDGTLIAFSRLTEAGNRVFVQDLVTGIERQVTFGPGNDEQPSFAPDSYFLAFTSTRSGSKQIYLITRHGGDAKKLPTGDGEASFPRWGKISR